MASVMTAMEAVRTYIKDGATAGMGDGKNRGLNHLGVEGIVNKAIGGHWGLVPKLQKLAQDNKIAAYNLPQGVISQLYRDIAAGKPGLVTHVGLKTYVDPRVEGGKINEKARIAGDIAFLGLGQMDAFGNINVSKFGTRFPGCGGFINITQNAKKVVYCGTFTAGNLKVEAGEGKLTILQEGEFKKLKKCVEQITFSGEYAKEKGQTVLYITERAVFELTDQGIALTEIAPGIDLEKDILSLMDFKPILNDIKEMNGCIFHDAKMGIQLTK